MGNENPAAPHRMVARAGDTFTRIVTWTEDDGTPIDLTGASVEWSLAGHGKDVGKDVQYVDSPEASLVDPAGGKTRLHLTVLQTRDLAGVTMEYELTITLVDATRVTIMSGWLPVEREVLP